MDFYFLLFSLFFPRITMVVSFMFGSYPDNSVWLIFDWILGLFLPRVLVLIYIYQNMGYENPWFWIHLAVALLVYFGGSHRSARWYVARRDVQVSKSDDVVTVVDAEPF
jgi:hypothetical protein